MPFSPDDSAIIRIANALSEGCDGRSFASADAKWLRRRYEEWESRPGPAGIYLDNSSCVMHAYRDFIAGVLNGEIPESH